MTEDKPQDAYLAFVDDTCIARGSLPEVALAVRRATDQGLEAAVIVLDARTSHVVDLDLRGSDEDIVARLAAREASTTAPGGEAPSALRTGGPGRPRLGVVSREVSMLPRHWDWLATQRGGASAALRRLVDKARQASAPHDRFRAAQESVDRYLRVLAGDRPNYEEAVRAFYAGRDADLFRLAAPWPADVRGHLRTLVQRCRELAP